MADDKRNHPRAKVLSMTVRYKSATIDDFVEHHSDNVSRGGIFIKTSSPFPPGTLLKFEIRIADDEAVLAGVGRVVWKRDEPGDAEDEPAGMGVKFIKLDEKSRALISRLVEAAKGKESKYDRGFAQEAKKKATKKVKKGTLLGLGAIGAEEEVAAKAEAEEERIADFTECAMCGDKIHLVTKSVFPKIFCDNEGVSKPQGQAFYGSRRKIDLAALVAIIPLSENVFFIGSGNAGPYNALYIHPESGCRELQIFPVRVAGDELIHVARFFFARKRYRERKVLDREVGDRAHRV